MLKIVDGCSLNNRYWVFLAALTNVEFHITVLRHLDRRREALRQHARRLGAAITDTSAFQTCP